jgi:hypothetical protein
MKLIKHEPGFYDVIYKGLVIGEIQKKGTRWYGFVKRGYLSEPIIATTSREATVKVLKEARV